MGQRVLLIEDEPNIIEAISYILSKDGWTVHTHADGETAMDKVLQAVPDLIILDVMMPLQSGIRLYRALKTDAAFANIPVIILSGISQRSFNKSQEALTAFEGSDIPAPEAYIEKPADFETLAAQIKNCIHRK